MEGGWLAAAVRTNIEFGSLKQQGYVYAMWLCSIQGGMCDSNIPTDGIIGLAYESLLCWENYIDRSAYNSTTCFPSNYGQECTPSCTTCKPQSCKSTSHCNEFCTDAVNKLGQQYGDMKTLPNQMGITEFGMYLHSKKDGSLFVVKNPLQKTHLYTGVMRYTPVTSFGYYTVELMNIQVVGLSPLVIDEMTSTQFMSRGEWRIKDSAYDNNLHPSVIDSGTSGIGIWNSHIVDALLKALNMNGYTTSYGNCILKSDLSRPLHDWPDIELVFKGGAQMRIPATSYMNAEYQVGALIITCPPGYYAWGVRRGEPNYHSILGNGVFWPYYLIFDRVNSRVGWASK